MGILGFADVFVFMLLHSCFAMADDDLKDLKQLKDDITDELASCTKAWVCLRLLYYGNDVRNDCLKKTKEYSSYAINVKDSGSIYSVATHMFEHIACLRSQLNEIDRLMQAVYLAATK